MKRLLLKALQFLGKLFQLDLGFVLKHRHVGHQRKNGHQKQAAGDHVAQSQAALYQWLGKKVPT